MIRLLQPREPGARRTAAEVSSLVWLLAFLLLAARASADERFNTEKLQFDPQTAAIIAGIEKKHAAVKPPPEVLTTSTSEAERVAVGNLAIEDALRASGVPVAAARNVEREYREVLETELHALGPEAELLEPAEDELDGDTVPDPLDLPPRPRRVTQTLTAGIDHHDFDPTGVSAITTDINFAEYRLQFQDQPAPKSRLHVNSSILDSSARRSGIGNFDFDYRFDRHFSGSLGGTAIVERWNDAFRLDDNLLGSAFANLILHLPEQLDVSARHTFITRALDQETADSFSTLNRRTELRIEKRMHGGTARFAYTDHQLDIPGDPSDQLSHNIVLAGYTAPIHKKIDVDLAYIRTDEKRNFAPTGTGAFIQRNSQLNLLFRFSHAMNLSLDGDTETRDYAFPDVTFVSYRRTLLALTFNIVQTRHLAYSLGYATDFTTHHVVPPEFGFTSSQLDYHTEHYTAGLSYQKKRLTAVANGALIPTRFNQPSVLQTASRAYTTAGTVFYDLDSCTRATVAYSRLFQEFDALAANNKTKNVTAELSRSF